jgi:hypothetical protein
MFKSGLIDKVGLFDEELKAAEDTDWFIRVSEFFCAAPIDRVLIFKDHSSKDRLTSKYDRIASAYGRIISKNREEIMRHPYLIRRWYYKWMWLNIYSGRKVDALVCYKQLRDFDLLTFKVRLVFLLGRILSREMFIKLHKQLARSYGHN